MLRLEKLNMKITLTSIPVVEQQRALEFYTQKLGFVKQNDTPLGEYRWLTVISPEGTKGIELLLEPLGFAPAKEYQQALYSAGIPVTTFETDNLKSEAKRLKEQGVEFNTDPQDMGDFKMAIFDDTCGNLICLTEKNA